MYGQRCGSSPVARRTGGLADSIEDGLTASCSARLPSRVAWEAIDRALNIFGNTDILQAMRHLAIAPNFSWFRSASSYEAIYARAVAQNAARSGA